MDRHLSHGRHLYRTGKNILALNQLLHSCRFDVAAVTPQAQQQSFSFSRRAHSSPFVLFLHLPPPSPCSPCLILSVWPSSSPLSFPVSSPTSSRVSGLKFTDVFCDLHLFLPTIPLLPLVCWGAPTPQCLVSLLNPMTAAQRRNVNYKLCKLAVELLRGSSFQRVGSLILK